MIPVSVGQITARAASMRAWAELAAPPLAQQIICNDVEAMADEIVYLRSHLLDLAVQLQQLYADVTNDQTETQPAKEPKP